jgi:endonuclease/exonuclease/phosphatase family metal-dependent hydrolase
MPRIVDPLPASLQTELDDFGASLDDQVPAKDLDRNLLIATWNLRAFGDLTEKWLSQDGDSPKRDLYSVRCIAEVLSRFDVIALQEVKGNIKSLRHAIKVLNRTDRNWGLILTDVTRGDPGNDERMAFLFDLRRVQPSGLAAELVVPETRTSIDADALDRQFARTPYAVSFISANKTFILVTLHVIYGKQPRDRIAELRAIARWMADWAADINSFGQNLIALGDFNIDRHDDPLYQAFTSTGLTTPPELNDVPRTIFGSGGTAKHYDQVAWFTGSSGAPRLSLDYTGRGGTVDFVSHVQKTLTKLELSWRISDHCPLWVEFSIR